MVNKDFINISCGFCRQYEKMIIPEGKWKLIKFPANVFLLPVNNGWLMFDSGYSGSLKQKNKNLLIWIYTKLIPTECCNETSCFNQLKKINFNINNIKYIFISHFHIDHIGGLKDFKNCKFICSKEEYKNLSGIYKKMAKEFLPEDFEKRVIYIEDFKNESQFYELKSYEIFNNIYAIHLPGHTNNQYGLYIKNNETFLAADSVWCKEAYINKKLPNKLSMKIMENEDEYKKTIEKIHNIYIQNKNIKIIYSHQGDI